MLLVNFSRRQGWGDFRSAFFSHMHPTRTARKSLRGSPLAQRDHPSLSTLPPEILEKIFRSACTDGGRTGCSLSLVSKTVRAVSMAARYHSISLLAGSPGKLRGFLECFENARSAARSVEGSATPRIRHLCLALSPATPTALSYQPGGKVLDLHRWLDTSSAAQYWDKAWTSYSKHAVNDYHAAIQTLFRMVSGDVQSMCLFGSNEWWEDDLTGMPPIACSGFPMLTELAISGEKPRLTLLPERTHALDTLYPGSGAIAYRGGRTPKCGLPAVDRPDT
ncbi:hypothetical protein LXA43DRAFT_268738 [Ganoderma leucocontextum]|nr:hypothetical protein LXA43DRAFT_268738 [Ganoderma leucocontextum]